MVDGTFFDRDGEPFGLLRQGDVESSPRRDADWGVGIRGRRAYP